MSPEQPKPESQIPVFEDMFRARTRSELVRHLERYRGELLDQNLDFILKFMSTATRWKKIPVARYPALLQGCREYGINEYLKRVDTEMAPKVARYGLLWNTFFATMPTPETAPLGHELLDIVDDLLFFRMSTTAGNAAVLHRTKGEILSRLASIDDKKGDVGLAMASVEDAYAIFKSIGDQRACAECASTIVTNCIGIIRKVAGNKNGDANMRSQVFRGVVLATNRTVEKYREDIDVEGPVAARLEMQLGIINATAQQYGSEAYVEGVTPPPPMPTNGFELLIGHLLKLYNQSQSSSEGQKPSISEAELLRPLMEAVRMIRPDADLGMWLSMQRMAGLVDIRNGKKEGTSALRTALQTGRRLILSATDNVAREKALGELAKLAEALADAAAMAGDLPLLYWTAARGRTVRSSVYAALARIESDPALQDVVELRRRIARMRIEAQDLKAEVQRIEAEITQAARLDLEPTRRWAPLVECNGRLSAKTAELTTTANAFSALLAEKGIVTSLDPPPLSGFATAIPKGGVGVLIISGSEQGWILVVPHGIGELGPEHLVRLPDLTTDAVDELIGIKEGSVGWLQAYNGFKERLDRPLRIDGPETTSFSDSIDRVGERLWSVVMGPLDAALRRLGFPSDGTTDVVLLPPGKLAILPLATAWRHDGQTERPFLEDWVVAVSQSPQALAASAERLRTPRSLPDRVLGVTDPLGDLTRGLGAFNNPGLTAFPPSSRDELRGAAATKPAVLAALSSASHVSFYTHGIWDPSNPALSGLVLCRPDRQQGEPRHEILSYTDLQRAGTNLAGGRLWVLAACETGALDLQLPDEFAGIGAGLASEVPAILSTLYPVDASITDLVIRTFMHLHVERGMSPARALRLVQLALRQGRDAALALLGDPSALSPVAGPMHMTVPLFFNEPEDEDEDEPIPAEGGSGSVDDAWKRSYFWCGYQLAGL